MKQRFLIILALLPLSLLLVDCNRIKDPIPEYTQRIYPLETGQSRIYLVWDTTYTVQDTIVDWFYRKEVIGETETDLLGREVYRVETFRSEYALGQNYEFKPERVWTVYKDEEYVERYEENQRYLVLKFPVFPGIRWNGNLYNGLGEQAFKYQSIDTVLQVNGVEYDPLVFVMNSLPSDSTSQINYRIAYELYAPDIGKVMQFDITKVYRQPGDIKPDPDRSYSHIEMLVEAQ
jgi:hypothetical protein